MTEDHKLNKVNILIQQHKYDEAERIIKDLLSFEPNNVYLLSLFAEVNLQLNQINIAENVIKNAIGIAPEEPHLFYIKSRIEAHKKLFEEAEFSIKQAIALNPFDADYFAMLAHYKLTAKSFQEALDIANKALEIDPENVFAINTRSTALIKLNKSDEAFNTIEGALRQDPNNSYTHANYGWGLLEKGNPKKALEHFKESLKNDPNSSYAQSGMIEALKATNPIYRLFLKYSFWMSNLTSKYQWAMLIGFYFSFKILSNIAINNEALQPFLTPIIILLAVVAFSTWVIQPISNLFLRFNKYGNVLLSKKEKISSSFVAASVAFAALGLILYMIFREERFLSIVVVGLAMMLPLSVMFSPSKYKYVLMIYTILLASIGVLSIFIALYTGNLTNGLFGFFLLAFFIFQWVGNFLIMQK